VVDKVALGQVFSKYFGFTCRFSFYPLLHTHHHQHLSSGAGTIGQTVADVPSGLSLIPPQETKKETKNYYMASEGCTFKNLYHLTNFWQLLYFNTKNGFKISKIM
jgi:hypothetical protein